MDGDASLFLLLICLLAFQVSYWYSANAVQQAVGGLLSFGVSHIKNPNIKSWQVRLRLVFDLASKRRLTLPFFSRTRRFSS